MKKPHKHAELIKAWADGAEIQIQEYSGNWRDTTTPSWCPRGIYRIKPEPAKDFVKYVGFNIKCDDVTGIWGEANDVDDLIDYYSTIFRVVFDGETQKIKSVSLM